MSAPSILWLFRPTLPSPRAQSIQSMNMAHALARQGCAVTLIGNRAVEESLNPYEYYDLEPLPSLSVSLLPGGATAASVLFRARVMSWLLKHPDGIIYARSKRYASQIIPWMSKRQKLVLEMHEVDSLLAEERGEPADSIRNLECRVLKSASGVVTNAAGTLSVLQAAHSTLPVAMASPNGTHRNRVRTTVSTGVGVGYLGSLRRYKDLNTLALAAKMTSLPISLVTPEFKTPEANRLRQVSGNRLRIVPAVPYSRIPDTLRSFQMVVIPLSDGLFGRSLTSPLKLWDALAARTPIVGADLPSLHEAAPGAFVPYTPGNPSSLVESIERLATDEALRCSLAETMSPRTWCQRAGEVVQFLELLG